FPKKKSPKISVTLWIGERTYSQGANVALDRESNPILQLIFFDSFSARVLAVSTEHDNRSLSERYVHVVT
ncbi:MAG: hypothetical protein AAGD40_04010, partial [Pseudomonadota bacterium]